MEHINNGSQIRRFTEDYISRNLLGFEGDYYIGEEIEKLCKQFNIQQIIETGTFLGATTLQLAKYAPVKTVEINNHFYEHASKNIFETNFENSKGIEIHLADTVNFLNELSASKQLSNDTLYFLDAHWENYCPLLEELKIIAESKTKPVIVIHDFKVPHHPKLNFDQYNGQDFDFEWIKDSLDNIYGEDGYEYYYNSQEKSAGAFVGVIYIHKK
jgi:predicted O-methyltransferase YrrM